MRTGSFIKLMAVIFVLSVTIHAQPKPPSKEERLTQLSEKLNLTKDQVNKISTIFDAADEQMQALHESSSGDRREMMDKVKSIMDNADEQIKEVLTSSQKEKFEEMKKEREKRRPPQGEGEQPAGGSPMMDNN